MERTAWYPIKQTRCERIDDLVALEAKVVFPADMLPDPKPRVLAHRCSHGIECNRFEKPSCIWSGTGPGHDPLN